MSGEESVGFGDRSGPKGKQTLVRSSAQPGGSGEREYSAGRTDPEPRGRAGQSSAIAKITRTGRHGCRTQA